MTYYAGPTVPMYRLTVLDPELAGTPTLPPCAAVYVCVDCYGQAGAEEFDGLHDDDTKEEVPPRRCLFCGSVPFVYDHAEASARDARPDCP